MRYIVKSTTVAIVLLVLLGCSQSTMDNVDQDVAAIASILGTPIVLTHGAPANVVRPLEVHIESQYGLHGGDLRAAMSKIASAPEMAAWLSIAKGDDASPSADQALSLFVDELDDPFCMIWISDHVWVGGDKSMATAVLYHEMSHCAQFAAAGKGGVLAAGLPAMNEAEAQIRTYAAQEGMGSELAKTALNMYGTYLAECGADAYALTLASNTGSRDEVLSGLRKLRQESARRDLLTHDCLSVVESHSAPAADIKIRGLKSPEEFIKNLKHRISRRTHAGYNND